MTGLLPPDASLDVNAIDAVQSDAQQREAHQIHFHREQLSAMMDGMLSADESRFLLRRMQHDAELAGRWERWQLFGDAMRGQAGRALPADFNRRIAIAIAADTASQSQVAIAVAGNGSTTSRSFVRWGGGAAIAASVAIAALIGSRAIAPKDASSSSAVITAVASPISRVNAVAPASMPAASAAPTLLASTPVMSDSALPASGASSTDITPSASKRTRVLAADAALASVAMASSMRRNAARDQGQFAESASTAGAASSLQSAAVVASAVPSQAPNHSAVMADPFGRQLDLSPKPWPRALLPETASVGGVTVDYSVGSSAFHPSFQPRVELQPNQVQAADASAVEGKSPSP